MIEWAACYLWKSSQRKLHKTAQTTTKERLESLWVFSFVSRFSEPGEVYDARSQTKAKLQTPGKESTAAQRAPSHSSHQSPCQQRYAPLPLRPPPLPPAPRLLPYVAQQRVRSMLSLAYLHKACCCEDFDLSWCQCHLNPSNKIEPAAKQVKNNNTLFAL